MVNIPPDTTTEHPTVENAPGSKSHLKSPWNLATSYLTMLYREQELGCCSGFFWKSNDRTFLVSNWHNFSGRHQETGKPLSSTAGLPNRVRFSIYQQRSEADANGFFEMQAGHITVPLYDNDLEGPRWLHHPKLGPQVDVAAIDISEALSTYGVKFEHVNVVESDAILQPFASQDVFIIGYPLGLITGMPSPIWKRGTIANDPTFDPDGLPKMFVDSATRKAMSGSVVVARHIVHGRIKKKDGTETAPVLYGVNDVVIGIYSGRLGADLVQAQLGIVWKRSTIEETINGNAIASV